MSPTIKFRTEVEESENKSISLLNTKLIKEEKRTLFVDWHKKPRPQSGILNFKSKYQLRQMLNIITKYLKNN